MTEVATNPFGTGPFRFAQRANGFLVFAGAVLRHPEGVADSIIWGKPVGGFGLGQRQFVFFLTEARPSRYCPARFIEFIAVLLSLQCQLHRHLALFACQARPMLHHFHNPGAQQQLLLFLRH